MAKIMGFFSEEALDSVGTNGAGSGACEKCGLNVSCKSPMMNYSGNGEKRILIIAECPSEAEDKNGKPFSGDTGEWFRSKLKSKGIDLDQDCWKVNAVACHPGKQKDHKPTKAQIKSCRPRLMKIINELKPRHIWLMGADAIYSYYHERESNTNAERWRGLCIPDPERKAWVLPLYHPQFAIRNEKDNHFMSVYDGDLSHAIKCSKFTERPESVPLNGARIVKTFEETVMVLKKTLADCPNWFAFDYETTGLKPYRSGHRIASISFCYDYDTSYSFPYQYRTHWTKTQIDTIGDLWIDIMLNPKIKKVAHNSKFEDMWTREIFGIDIVNLDWCTMNTAHILDGRTEFSGLKFQGLIRWGIPDYDSSMEKYLRSAKDTPYNRVMEAPINDLLLYGSIDSLATFRLREEQEDELADKPGPQKARLLFQQGLHTLCNLQENGIPLNRNYYIDKAKDLTNRIEKAKNNLHNLPEAQKFLRMRGKQINFGSSTDLSDLFFNILGLPKGKLTPGGAPCVDASVLASLNTPIAKEITKISKLEKINGTYLGQFNREIEDDGKLHPFFDLHTTNTFRGSSSSPNFQNIPVRDFEAMSITRGGIIPSRGNRLVDWDYGAMEVRIIACVSQDPILVNYCNDLSSDMHRDQAKSWFSFTDAEWDNVVAIGKKEEEHKRNAKNIRFEAKNGFVFAEFYGSYFKSIARSMFPKLKELHTGEMTLFEHLRHKGVIRSLSSAEEDFENHTKRTEQKFWDRFKVLKKWQDKAFASYIEKGYIEQITGFRCSGWLSRNDICNYHIQGPAFHCLVWSLNQLDKQMKQEKMDSQLNGQIHDCCLGDIVPEEHDHWCIMSHKIATKEIKDHFKWLIVTLLTEFEMTGIDAPWSTKEEFIPKFLNH